MISVFGFRRFRFPISLKFHFAASLVTYLRRKICDAVGNSHRRLFTNYFHIVPKIGERPILQDCDSLVQKSCTSNAFLAYIRACNFLRNQIF
jgi:hypothetical protein